MANFFTLLFLHLSFSFGYCFDASYPGPKVGIQTPWRGQRLASLVQVSLHLNIGSGPDAVQIQSSPHDYKVCVTGGNEMSCVPVLGGAEVGFINVAYFNGISEVSAWIQHNDDLETMESAIGEGDIVIAYDSPLQAVPTLQDRVNGVGGWKRAPKAYMQAFRHLDLGRALMRVQSTQGGSALVQAAAALGKAVALGNIIAIGALEEVFWLSGPKEDAFPLFQCKYNGVLDVPLLTGGPRDRAVFGVYTTAVYEWADARVSLSVSLAEHCEGHPLFEECVSEGIKHAQQALLGVCGNLVNLSSVVSAHAGNPSDINEHILTLESLASEGSSVLELGVRGCSSSWAFLLGLKRGGGQHPRLIQNDIDDCFSTQFDVMARSSGVPVEYHWQDDLTLQLRSRVDLIFIDTYHVYGQLKRELKKFAPYANKYIVLHDTTVDGDSGELVRLGHDMTSVLMDRPGWVAEDVTGGLWRAVEEFLAINKDWTLHHRYTNNNGLTVLRRAVPLVESEVDVIGGI